MKPRLVAPLTLEDRDIWIALAERTRTRPGWFASLSFISREQGRRDADLMFYAQQHKLVTWVGPPLIHIRNAVSAYWSDTLP